MTFSLLPPPGVSCGAPPLTDHGAYVDYLGQVIIAVFIILLIMTLQLRRQNSLHFYKGHFQNDFLKNEFGSKSSWKQGSNFLYVSIGSYNGLVPNMQQSFIWNNNSLFYWVIYATLCFNDLKCIHNTDLTAITSTNTFINDVNST